MSENKKKILVVAAHPDDEILGCGGTMAKYSDEGCEIHILILAEGLTSRDSARNRSSKNEELSDLAKNAKLAALNIGAKSIELLDFPDNRMDSIDRLDIIKVIERKVQEIKPFSVFTHFSNDLNVDHRITSESVVTACRPIPRQVVKEIFFFEVPSSTEWQIGQIGSNFYPNCFFVLSESNFEKKMNSLRYYESEMREFPHARSLDAVLSLAKWRGSNIGENVSEAFMVARMVR